MTAEHDPGSELRTYLDIIAAPDDALEHITQRLGWRPPPIRAASHAHVDEAGTPAADRRDPDDEPHYSCTRCHCAEGDDANCWAQAEGPP